MALVLSLQVIAVSSGQVEVESEEAASNDNGERVVILWIPVRPRRYCFFPHFG